MKTLSNSKWTGWVLFVGLLGCGDSSEVGLSSGSSSDTDESGADEIGTDESASESASSGASTDGTATASSTSDNSTTSSSDTASSSEGSTADTADTDALGCADVCGTPGCGDCPQTVMVDGGGYGIEATETTVANYAAFMNVEFSSALLNPDCAWKKNFEPEDWSDQLASPSNMPVTQVDWCDADAYCRWSGGHLCGTIGGGPTALGDTVNPDTEWYAACSNGGISEFAYGSMYIPTACNGFELGLGTFQVVGALESCQGGLPGLYDMSGNIREWTNGCGLDPLLTDPAQLCQRRGGGYTSDQGSLDCESSSERERSHRGSTTGIRCCSEG